MCVCVHVCVFVRAHACEPPLANDLRVCLDQIVRDVPSRQVLQSISGTEFHLNDQHRDSESGVTREPQQDWFMLLWQSLTSGGGSPPAPGGQSGSIFLLPPPSQEQAGEGWSMVQFSELKTCWRTSGTSGYLQSSSPMVHGASLDHSGTDIR